jgi:hypothetical protein
MCVRGAGCGCAPSPVIAACFAPTAQCRVRQFKRSGRAALTPLPVARASSLAHDTIHAAIGSPVSEPTLWLDGFLKSPLLRRSSPRRLFAPWYASPHPLGEMLVRRRRPAGRPVVVRQPASLPIRNRFAPPPAQQYSLRHLGASPSPVNAPVWGTGGPEFKSRRSDHDFNHLADRLSGCFQEPRFGSWAEPRKKPASYRALPSFTPGSSPFVKITPPASSARCMAARLLPMGVLRSASKSLIVERPTPALAANSSCVHLRMPRAPRDWAGVIMPHDVTATAHVNALG